MLAGIIVMGTATPVGDGTLQSCDQCSDTAVYSRSTVPPYVGPPNGWIQGPRRGREYGPDGYPRYDFDKPHQGEPQDHVHEWEDGVREHSGRPYSPWPKQSSEGEEGNE